jgi:hypothetical protein
MEKRKMTKTLAEWLLTGTLLVGSALPAAAGTGPRTDIGAGHLGLGFDPGAFSLDLGISPNLIVGVDARESTEGTAWGGIGARATLRLLGNADGWNLGLGGRLSIPSTDFDALTDSRVKDVGTAFQNMGAASAYVLLSMPITPWFIMRYPIGMTYYVGPDQNGGQAWTFGSGSWSPNDPRTMAFSSGGKDFYLPVLQFLPETALKFGGFEATLFGSSIAGIRLTF